MVHLISGQQLPSVNTSLTSTSVTEEDERDPYVVVTLVGAKKDEKRYRSSTIQNNGYNPVWNEVTRISVNY
jgi:Ca2+-dependent lipid-binding protein